MVLDLIEPTVDARIDVFHYLGEHFRHIVIPLEPCVSLFPTSITVAYSVVYLLQNPFFLRG